MATKAEEIALTLETAILSGDLAPGTMLRQEQLSEELGVSRTPVREALRELAAVGLVTLEPNRGARVHAVSRAELRETFPIRAALERLAAELALPRMTAKQLRRLRTSETRFEKATRALQSPRGDELERHWLTSEWVRANSLFHDVILEAAGSPLLERMAQSVRRVFHGQIVWSNAPDVSRLYERNLAQHRAIREAFQDKSPKASMLAYQHVLDSGELLDHLLAQDGSGRSLLRSGRSRV